jgi:acetyl-CoA carboxylase carboxyltransferase component
LVKAAIGESIDNETLGGATTLQILGVTDYKQRRQRRFRQNKKNS